VVRISRHDVSFVKAGFGRLGHTLGQIRRYKQLLIFLVAFWIYNDGIGTIIKMATAYGDEIGIGLTDMTLALIITQFVGIPFAFGFGWLARRLGTKRSILLALGVYVLISIAGYFMQTAFHFYILAFMVGTVQGGSQALSRSLYGTMVPKSQSAEFFGFYSTSSKFAGIIGPLIFGVVSQLAGASRLSILSVIVFFIVGGFLLTFVDEEEGRRVARQEDIELGLIPTT
jgi:MFS transporter, UMF1 family